MLSTINGQTWKRRGTCQKFFVFSCTVQVVLRHAELQSLSLEGCTNWCIKEKNERINLHTNIRKSNHRVDIQHNVVMHYDWCHQPLYAATQHAHDTNNRIRRFQAQTRLKNSQPDKTIKGTFLYLVHERFVLNQVRNNHVVDIQHVIDVCLDVVHERAHEDRDVLERFQHDVMASALGQEPPRTGHVLRRKLGYDLAHLWLVKIGSLVVGIMIQDTIQFTWFDWLFSWSTV